MADSNAARQMRHRRHKQGDHSGCRPGCQDARTSPEIAAPAPDPGEEFDVRAELRVLAMTLKGAYAADPANALLARELRATLVELQVKKDDKPDPFSAFVAGLGGPVHTEVRDPAQP